jgi:hypothetical protein
MIGIKTIYTHTNNKKLQKKHQKLISIKQKDPYNKN